MNFFFFPFIFWYFALQLPHADAVSSNNNMCEPTRNLSSSLSPDFFFSSSDTISVSHHSQIASLSHIR
ncbi:unnamed protein product [Citrullus colocynthis]|uniref:Secreted protein n=1 Tax=Citrullus colocynthis TaxID=252529 RepID=A0ABP0YKG8_9ROSI